MGETNNQPFLAKIADRLLKDQQELDLLAVQISLGKAEAKDRFEEAKKQFKKSVRDFKEVISMDKKLSKDWARSVKGKLNDLEAHLAKGKANTKAVFTEQKKNILKGIEDLKKEIKRNPYAIRLADYFTAATEKMNLQMALFEKNMGSKKTELTNEFKEEMNNAREKLNAIIEKTKEKKDDIEVKIEKFNDEIHQSFEHLKKAFKAL